MSVYQDLSILLQIIYQHFPTGTRTEDRKSPGAVSHLSGAFKEPNSSSYIKSKIFGSFLSPQSSLQITWRYWSLALGSQEIRCNRNSHMILRIVKFIFYKRVRPDCVGAYLLTKFVVLEAQEDGCDLHFNLVPNKTPLGGWTSY